jgi:hypothetical protein
VGLFETIECGTAVFEPSAKFTDPYYMSNLPSECPAKAKGADDSERATSETVRRTVAETRKRLSDPAVKWDTFLAGRNLLILLARVSGLSSVGTPQERKRSSLARL